MVGLEKWHQQMMTLNMNLILLDMFTMHVLLTLPRLKNNKWHPKIV